MKQIVAFICTGNSCRSQMAEGFAIKYGFDIFNIYSAGTIPVESVNPDAIKVMEEVGVDIRTQYPKTLKDIPENIDIVITMGCIKGCPVVNSKIEEDWGLDDPVGKSLDEFRRVRDIIEEKVIDLVKRVNQKCI